MAIFRAEQGVGSSNLPGRAISFLFNDLREKRSSAFLTDDRDEMLGVEGLEELVRKSAQKTLPEMKQAILAGVAEWRHGPLTDDMSLVLVELR